MKFGPQPLEQALGLILAHSVRKDGVAFKKGRRLEQDDIAALRAQGVTEVIGAVLEDDDVAEDEAAMAIANAVLGSHVRAGRATTGRVNLFAKDAGLLLLDQAAIDRLNQVDEAMTVATLPAHAAVKAGQMVATVKIIPFAVERRALARLLDLAATPDAGPPGRAAPGPGAVGAAIRLEPFQALEAALIQTRLSGTKETVLDKTVSITAERLSALGGRLGSETRCEHRIEALAARIAAARGHLILIAGASAITDRRDVLPAAILAAGGEVLHFGMPVDPGNLLLLARHEGRPVLGLPGCARSPKLNGFDWVLQRLFAGIPIDRADIMKMGVGGLLTEIPSRPQPREGGRSAAGDKVAGILLAAGQSRRMGKDNKLLAPVQGRPMVLHALEALLGSRARPVIVVTGHEAEAVRRAIGDLPVTLVHNPRYAEGLSTSLRAALDALPEDSAGFLVALGDMPRVRAADIDRLIAAFNPIEGRAICVPVARGKRGNPVLFARHHMAEMLTIGGDVGARHLIGANEEEVCEVEMDDDAALADIDTPAALAALLDRLPDSPHDR